MKGKKKNKAKSKKENGCKASTAKLALTTVKLELLLKVLELIEYIIKKLLE